MIKFDLSYLIYLPLLLVPLILIRKWFKGPRANLKRNLTGKFVIITGSNAGIGLETAITLIDQGATVIFACRNEERTNSAIKANIPKEKQYRAIFMQIDLSDAKTIFAFAEQYKKRFGKIDILINNAGQIDGHFIETKDHMESIVNTIFIGHFMLTALLIKCLNPEARIINAGSHITDAYHPDYSTFENDYNFENARTNYSCLRQYTISKIGLITYSLFLKDYFRRHKVDAKLAVYHPGWVHTTAQMRIGKWWVTFLYILTMPALWYFLKTAYDGAQSTLQAANIDYVEMKDAGYFYDCRQLDLQESLNTEENVHRYMSYAKRMVKRKIHGIPDELEKFMEEIKDTQY